MVKVQLPSANVHANGETVEHENGRGIKVVDGHLHVYQGASGNPTYVAIYAPQKWVSAVTEN